MTKIEKLEKAREYFLDADKFNNNEAIDWFMKFTIDIFKDLKKEVNDVKNKDRDK